MKMRNWRMFIAFQRYFNAMAKKRFKTISPIVNSCIVVPTLSHKLSIACNSASVSWGYIISSKLRS